MLSPEANQDQPGKVPVQLPLLPRRVGLTATQRAYVAECDRRAATALTEARVWEEAARAFLATIGAAEDPTAIWDLEGGELVQRSA